jgi:hypothetical protein
MCSVWYDKGTSTIAAKLFTEFETFLLVYPSTTCNAPGCISRHKNTLVPHTIRHPSKADYF